MKRHQLDLFGPAGQPQDQRGAGFDSRSLADDSIRPDSRDHGAAEALLKLLRQFGGLGGVVGGEESEGESALLPSCVCTAAGDFVEGLRSCRDWWTRRRCMAWGLAEHDSTRSVGGSAVPRRSLGTRGREG